MESTSFYTLDKWDVSKLSHHATVQNADQPLFEACHVTGQQKQEYRSGTLASLNEFTFTKASVSSCLAPVHTGCTLVVERQKTMRLLML